MDIRLRAEGSDWKRDEGETLEQWAIRCIDERAALRDDVAMLNLCITGLRKRVEVLERAVRRQLGEHDGGHSPCSCQELRAALAETEGDET